MATRTTRGERTRWLAIGVLASLSGLACSRTPLNEKSAAAPGQPDAGGQFGGMTGSTQDVGGRSGGGAGGKGESGGGDTGGVAIAGGSFAGIGAAGGGLELGGGLGASGGQNGSGGLVGTGGRGLGGTTGVSTMGGRISNPGGASGGSESGELGGSASAGRSGVGGAGGGSFATGITGGRSSGGTGVGGGSGGTGGLAGGGRAGTGGVGGGGTTSGGGVSGLGGGGAGATGGTGVGGTAGSGSGGSGGQAICGDGFVQPGEQCDLGAANADRPAFVVTQDSLIFTVTPYAQVASSANFYDYVSSSGHTGLEKLDTSLILLYLDRQATALSLVVEHGIDANTTSQQQPAAKVQMLFSGLPAGCAVAVSDDAGELAMSSATTAAGRWSFKGNTDGGVLSGFPIPGSWEVLISPAFLSGITSWTWMQGSSAAVSLDLTVPLDIKAYASRSLCRTNCTIPRCGDGILDGGEVCDDGNTVDGDGCSSDCLSAQ
jgi:cysteine-rich repeat protein